MITAFLIHCLGIKRKFQKKAAILVFVTVFFVYLEIQTFFTSFENYGVLLTLLVTGYSASYFVKKGWIEKVYLQCGHSDVFSGCGDYQRKHRRTDMECGICRTRRGCFGTENGGNAFNPAAIRHFYKGYLSGFRTF